MTTSAGSPADSPPVPVWSPSPGNQFRYGWRYVERAGPNGTVELDQVPLTLEDVLHPREGDVIPEIPRHEQERGYLTWGLRAQRPNDASVAILSDCLIHWGVEGLRDTSPDVSVFVDVKHQPDLNKGTFHLVPSGGRPVLVIELVSVDTRKNDVIFKVEEYHRAGVPLYVIVDQQREGGPREVIGYRYTPAKYEPLPLDDNGRLLLEPFNLLLGLRENWVALYDVATGKEVGDYLEVCQQLSKMSEELQKATEARRLADERIRELEKELRRRNGQN